MSVNNFIPSIWSDQLNQIFEKNLVYGARMNRDYEGEIRGYGDTVKINEIGDITISSYTKNSTTDITVQTLTDAQLTLSINKAMYFAFAVDDVDQAQTKPKLMQTAMERAGYNLKDNTDAYLAQSLSSGGFFTGTNSTELGSTGTALSVTSTIVITAMAWGARIMDQNNVPTNGRWIVVSPAIHHQMITANIVQNTNNSQYIANGPNSVGNFYGFDIYVSNNCYLGSAASSQYHCIFGHPSAVTFAGQINSVEAYRSQKAFRDEVRGLLVYGYKVTKPSAILRGVFTP